MHGCSIGWVGYTSCVELNICGIYGKGEHDGAGTCIKKALAHEELKYKDGEILIDAKSIYLWCNATMGLGKESESTVNSFLGL